MRVLSVQHYPTFGGPHNEILRLDGVLRERGVETIVAITDESGDALERLKDMVETHAIPLRRARQTANPVEHLRTMYALAGDISRIADLIDGLQIDLVKVHGPHNPQGALAARRVGKPVVWVVSSTRVPRLFRRAGATLVARLADSVLATGLGTLRSYPGLDRLRQRTVLYHPPVDTEEFRFATHSERAEIKAELGLDESSPVVGTIANINPQKGIEHFVRVAKRISIDMPEARFLVVGGVAATQVDYFARVREEADRLALTPGKLRFIGPRHDIARVLGAFDVKLLTSVPASEGSPTTVIEALACGIPVVATDVGAVAEVIQDGRTGYVVPPLDIEAMYAATVRILEDPDLRRTMSFAARDDATARFTTESCAEAHLEAYRVALHHHRDGEAPRSK